MIRVQIPFAILDNDRSLIVRQIPDVRGAKMGGGGGVGVGGAEATGGVKSVCCVSCSSSFTGSMGLYSGSVPPRHLRVNLLRVDSNTTSAMISTVNVAFVVAFNNHHPHP